MGSQFGPNAPHVEGDQRQRSGAVDPPAQKDSMHSFGPQLPPPPPDYDLAERHFFDRLRDEVRSWFGDHEAGRRRQYDEFLHRPYGDPRDQSSRLGFADPYLGNGATGYAPFLDQRSGFEGEWRPDRARLDYDRIHDLEYQAWRHDRIRELDRDYAEYRRENQARFENEFSQWRARRMEQRAMLERLKAGMGVIGNDGANLGTIDHVKGHHIILSTTAHAAGGHHHSLPARWIDRIDGPNLLLEKSTAEVHAAWRAQDAHGGLFGHDRGPGGLR